jgi:hypothetical protein
MRRRDFITVLGGAAATLPVAARAQQPAGRVYRIGYLSVASREKLFPFIKSFEEGLRSLSYRVGADGGFSANARSEALTTIDGCSAKQAHSAV